MSTPRLIPHDWRVPDDLFNAEPCAARTTTTVADAERAYTRRVAAAAALDAYIAACRGSVSPFIVGEAVLQRQALDV